MKTPFNVFAFFPKWYVWSSASALNENESHYRPPYSTDPWRSSIFCELFTIIFLYIMPQDGLDLALNKWRRYAMTTLQIFIMLGLALPALIAVAWGIWDQRPSARKW